MVLAAFLALGVVALWRGARVLAGACCLLGMIFAGALTEWRTGQDRVRSSMRKAASR